MRISPRALRRSAWACLVAALTIGSSACAGAQAMSDPDECSVREVSRQPLMIGTTAYYIEPVVVTTSGNEVLLAGKPTYEWTDYPSRPELRGQNAVFGATLDASGTAHLIPAPIAGRRLKPMAAASIGDAEWAVVFGEMRSGADTSFWWSTGDTTGSRIEKLWYAELSRRQWRSIQELPLPADADNVWNTLSTDLAIRGDTSVWGVVHRVDGRPRAGVLERIAGRWSYHPLAVDPGYLTLAQSADGFILGIVAPDRSLPQDVNSLLAYRRNDSWELVRRAITGGEHEVHFPALSVLPDQSVLVTWQAIYEEGFPLYRMRSRILEQSGPIDMVAYRVRDRSWPVLGPTGNAYLVAKTDARDGMRLKVFDVGGESVREVWSTANPFEGIFRLTMTRPDEMLANGPLFDRQTETLTSLLLRLKIECSTRSSTEGR